MKKYVRMNVLFLTNLLQRRIMFVFPWSLASTTDEVEHPGWLSSNGEFLGVLSSNFSIFQSKRRSPTRDQHGAIAALYLVSLDIYILGVVDKSIYLLIF